MKLCMGCMNQMDEKLTVCPHCSFNEAALRQESYYLKPGTIIGGKYIVGKALSYGGYTVTYIGMDAEKTRKVMIKEYLPSDFSTRSEGDTEVTIYSGDACEQFEQGLTTFLNEANRIGQLHNTQGIMRVYDCVAENDTGYVISEYLEGKTLKQIMEEGKRFPVQEAKEFVCRILEGLRQVHPLNIIHCDISPETILVTNTGEIKLLDFGATRYVTTANSKSLAIILKQGFAPEEQYRSRGERGPWTDVYALGAVMYYMITGVVPVESVDRALMDELKEPSKLGIQIPPNTENALMNALNVYQKDRTPSAEIFYQELNSPQVSRIQVKKQKYETGKFPTWAKFLVAGLLCVVVAGGVIVGKYLLDEGNDDPHMGMSKVQVPNVKNMAEDKAKETIKSSELAFKVKDVIFDKDSQEGGKIIDQEPSEGTGIDKGEEVEVIVRSGEKCKYEDIFEQANNVDNLVDEFNIDENLLSGSKESDADDEDKTFKNLYEVILKDGDKIKKIKVDDLKKDREEIIKLPDIQGITYYVSPYLYVKELDDYEGRNVYDEDIKFAKYTESKKGKGRKKVKGKTGKPLYRAIYYSFDEKEGYIVKQKIKEGKKYYSFKDGNLFVTVKKRFTYDKEKAEDLIKNLKSKGFKVKSEGKGEVIDYITVEGKGGTRYFTEKDTITITRKEKQQAPSSENKTPSKSNGTEVSPPQPSAVQLF